MSQPDKVLDLAAGRDHSLVLRAQAGLLGWGGDGTGRLPLPAGVCSASDTENSMVFISHQPLRQITAGAGSSLALDTQGRAYAWGANRAGLGGQQGSITESTPRLLHGLPAIEHISGSEFFALALSKEGQLFHWGLLPGGAQTQNIAPARVQQAPACLTCSAGGSHALAIDRQRTIWAWGSNTAGQLGLGHLKDQATPIRLPALKRMKAVAAGSSHSLALDTNGSVWAWGSNQHGQLGRSAPSYSPEALKVKLPEAIAQIAAGQHVSYALSRSGNVYAWGWNASGQLGQGNQNALAGIQSIASLRRITQLAAGHRHVLASDGARVWAWGDNRREQLGTAIPSMASPILLNETQAL